MPVAKRRVSHVSKLDVALRAAVHEQVALCGVELGRGDDLRELLHIRGLDIDDVFRDVKVSVKPMIQRSTH